MPMSKISVGFDADTTGLVSGVKKAVQQLDAMSREMKGLNSTMGLVKFDVLVRGLSSIGGAISSVTGTLASFGASAFNGLRDAVTEATDIGEQLSKSKQIFGDTAEEIKKFSEAASAIGLSTKAALDATGTFGNLFTAMKLSQEDAAKYSLTMTKLAADLASFNNTSVDEAIAAIGAALRGEAEPIRRYGVLLDEATLKAIAFREGLIATEKEALTPAIKAQAAYAAILEQTVKAQGDFARTSDGLANMNRVVKAQMDNLLGDVGKIFEPFFAAATAAFSQVMQEVGPLLREIAQGISADITFMADAIKALVPEMRGFLDGLDGESIGKMIGQGIIEAVRTFAVIADYAIQQFRALARLVQSITGAGQSEAEKRLAEMQATVSAGQVPTLPGSNPYAPEYDPAFFAEMDGLRKRIAEERAAWDSFSLTAKFDDLVAKFDRSVREAGDANAAADSVATEAENEEILDETKKQTKVLEKIADKKDGPPLNVAVVNW